MTPPRKKFRAGFAEFAARGEKSAPPMHCPLDSGRKLFYTVASTAAGFPVASDVPR